MCGGTRLCQVMLWLSQGLSPRVRGNRPDQRHAGVGGRSIPACAGEPWQPYTAILVSKVYPRVCGGTIIQDEGPAYLYGLSPRVRGNRRHCRRYRSRRGSIPACAGEPLVCGPPGHSGPVYPRVCGGTAVSLALRSARRGLSPRVRGNPLTSLTSYGRLGSIPACAGEPAATPSTR